MAEAQTTMKSLYGKLQSAGYNPKYIRSLLPDWWDEEIASTPAGYQEASLRLGGLFGVQPSSLREINTPVALRVPEGRRFKRQAGHQEQQLDVACALAMSSASLSLRWLPQCEIRKPLPDAKVMRELLLADNAYINLQVLLDYVWRLGIPVIFLGYMPSKTKKMAGLAFEHQGVPVIVLTSGKQHGYLVFDLAHELAHIVLGHVSKDKCVVDQEIDDGAEDPDERAANRFALELLTGDPDCKIVPSGRHLYAQELASAAARYGEKHKIDPLHVALNYGYSQQHWQVAHGAVKIIAANTSPDQAILRQKLIAELRTNDIDDDDLMTLLRLTGEAVE